MHLKVTASQIPSTGLAGASSYVGDADLKIGRQMLDKEGEKIFQHADSPEI